MSTGLEVEIYVVKDGALPAVEALSRAIGPDRVRAAAGGAAVRTIQAHLNALPPNKRGWPSTGFYKGAARGTMWEADPKGVRVYVDNDARPGAMRQRYYGGTIRMKDKWLTIPARAEFYGKPATSFTNLRLAIFKSGAMALVVGRGGAGRVDFATGRELGVKGAGARARGVVAYWLRDEVEQDADPGVLPDSRAIMDAAAEAILDLLPRRRGG